MSAAPIEMKKGEPAPFDGALCDAACAEGIRVKRAACEETNVRLREAIEKKNVEIAQAPQQRPNLAVLAIAFLAGVVIGGSLAVYAVK